jgi:hypothetical protein
MQHRLVGQAGLALMLLLPASRAQAQQTSDSTPAPAPPPEAAADASPRSVDIGQQVLACARDVGLAAGFQAQLSFQGSVMHLWRPHLQSLDTNEMDYVRVAVYGRGSVKGLRWEVEAHTLTGRAFIATSVYSPRPPSRQAGALRREIQQECQPKSP